MPRAWVLAAVGCRPGHGGHLMVSSVLDELSLDAELGEPWLSLLFIPRFRTTKESGLWAPSGPAVVPCENSWTPTEKPQQEGETSVHNLCYTVLYFEEKSWRLEGREKCQSRLSRCLAVQAGFKKPFFQLYARIAFLSIHCQMQDKDLKEGHGR